VSTEVAGTRLGRYLVVDVIGTGAFSTVYRATDERLGGEVAVKLLAENHSLDLDLRERFLREGRVLRRIDSQHVVGVHDAGENDRGQPYLVLELADRGELSARVGDLRAGGWTPDADAVRAVATALAEAVAAVHRAGAVHRDLSPGNVLLRSTNVPGQVSGGLLGDDERLLVADLGLSKGPRRQLGPDRRRRDPRVPATRTA
jgi:eukaryotic-like serine/threonine-protein kinase